MNGGRKNLEGKKKGKISPKVLTLEFSLIA